jgi:Rps23 Pro-64 3,4-dihydroxylase Tpa1-like proline 4-hydroxylase
MADEKALVRLILTRLEEERSSICEQWANPQGTATRHFVIDDLLPDDIAWEIQKAFPQDGEGFNDRGSFREKKRTSADLKAHAPILADITHVFQDPAIVQKIAEICGMQCIEPDPTLYAGGLSMMFKGDFLNPHIDNSHDGQRNRYRRINILYYVNPNWAVENGGNFELWDEHVKTPKTLVCHFNRLLAMETNRASWHSVSPVQVDLPRCCVSNYYFSKLSPDESNYYHVTSFTGRPEERMKRALGIVDNALRNTVAKGLGISRGKHLAKGE